MQYISSSLTTFQLYQLCPERHSSPVTLVDLGWYISWWCKDGGSRNLTKVYNVKSTLWGHFHLPVKKAEEIGDLVMEV